MICQNNALILRSAEVSEGRRWDICSNGGVQRTEVEKPQAKEYERQSLAHIRHAGRTKPNTTEASSPTPLPPAPSTAWLSPVEQPI